MKFFKANQHPLSVKEEYVAARLTALANRTKASTSDTDEPQGPAELPDASEAPEPRETFQ